MTDIDYVPQVISDNEYYRIAVVLIIIILMLFAYYVIGRYVHSNCDCRKPMITTSDTNTNMNTHTNKINGEN